MTGILFGTGIGPGDPEAYDVKGRPSDPGK